MNLAALAALGGGPRRICRMLKLSAPSPPYREGVPQEEGRALGRGYG